jgi:hypothetical protein
MRATEYNIPYETLMSQLRMLDRALQAGDVHEIVTLLRQIVREYAPMENGCVGACA